MIINVVIMSNVLSNLCWSDVAGCDLLSSLYWKSCLYFNFSVLWKVLTGRVAQATVVEKSLTRVQSHAPPISWWQIKQCPVGGQDTMHMAEVGGQNARIMMEDSLMNCIQLSKDSRLGVLIH